MHNVIYSLRNKMLKKYFPLWEYRKVQNKMKFI